MKILAIRDLLRDHYGLEPATAQKYLIICIFPAVFKLFFGLIVDGKVVSKRKYYLISGGALQAMSMGILSFITLESPVMACVVLMVNFGTNTFIDIVCESIII